MLFKVQTSTAARAVATALRVAMEKTVIYGLDALAGVGKQKKTGSELLRF